jgi:hypothetical protein
LLQESEQAVGRKIVEGNVKTRQVSQLFANYIELLIIYLTVA